MFGAADLEAKLAVGRYCPEKCRPASHAKLMARMVLRKTAIGLGMGSAAGTSVQIRDELVQFDATASYFDPDKDVAVGRPDQQVKLAGDCVMLLASGFQADMAAEPAALKDETGSGGELTNVFPQQPYRFGREKPVRRSQVGPEKFARNRALLVDRKKIFGQPAHQKLVFPSREWRSDP